MQSMTMLSTLCRHEQSYFYLIPAKLFCTIEAVIIILKNKEVDKTTVPKYCYELPDDMIHSEVYFWVFQHFLNRAKQLYHLAQRPY